MQDDQNTTAKQDIADVLGLGVLPPEEQDRLVEEAGQHIFQSTLLRAAESLSEAELKELALLFEASGSDPDTTGKRDAIFAFLTEHISNFGDIASEETARYFETAFEEISKE